MALEERVVVNQAGYWSIEGSSCQVTIEPRPSYCDRGRYIVNVHPSGNFALAFDVQDGFPRYYFDWNRMLAEIDAWMEARSQ